MRVVGLIPCRYGAERFPGKPIAEIEGKPMVWHVYQQAIKSKLLDEIIVATDDDRISTVCRKYSIPFLMTRSDHETGTDRLVECSSMIEADIYVNVQGDEPMIDPEAIDQVTNAILANQDSSVMASNGYAKIDSPEDASDLSVVKVTLKAEGLALSFSRLPIPYPKADPAVYLRQLGLYAFRKSGLLLFGERQPGSVERSEGVEMLRFLEHGYNVLMVETDDRDAIAVDTPEDLERVRAMFSSKALK